MYTPANFILDGWRYTSVDLWLANGSNHLGALQYQETVKYPP